MFEFMQQQDALELFTRHAESLEKGDLVKLVVLLWEQNRILQSKIAVLEKQNQDLQSRISVLEEQNQDLLDKLNLNYSNSSKPPSTDKPWDKQNFNKPKSGKKKGGQTGHEPHNRKLIDQDKVDKIIVVKPEVCQHCKAPLNGNDPQPRRYQVSEIPPVKATVTEYQLHSLECSNCHKTTNGLLQNELRNSTFGPNVVALIGLLTTQYHMSKRKTLEFLKDFFWLEMSLGAISECERKLSFVLEQPVEEIKKYVEAQSVANADETGWSESLKRAWVWVMTSKLATVFMIHLHRSQEAAKKLIGEFAGILGTDRYAFYNIFCGVRQICWAHLIRDFRRFSGYAGIAGEVGQKLLKVSEEIFFLWHNVRDGTTTRADFQKIMDPIISKIEDLLCDGINSGNSKMMESCYRIACCDEALLTFVRHEAVEPTNNAAESAIRPIVIWRKNCYGTQSENGSRYVERMMTTCATLRKQKRSVWEYVRQACSSYYAGEKAPSLLPLP